MGVIVRVSYDIELASIGIWGSMEEEFVYEDGSVDTPLETMLRLDSILHDISGQPGFIRVVEGLRCLCINPHASYGGGSRALWAVEGHSARLTFRGSGYLRGKCLRVSDDPAGILFQLNLANEKTGWEESKRSHSKKNGQITWTHEKGNRDTRFLSLDDIGRYEPNFPY